MTDELKAKIDAMSRQQMAQKWRKAPLGDPIFQGDTGTYFKERFEALGGFSPTISKAIDGEC